MWKKVLRFKDSFIFFGSSLIYGYLGIYYFFDKNFEKKKLFQKKGKCLKVIIINKKKLVN